MATNGTKKIAGSPSLETAAKIKEFCRLQIKERVTSKAEKAQLAKELGITSGGVEGLIYQGKGSFENYIAALAFLYELDANTLESFILSLRHQTLHTKPIRASDKIWLELDQFFSEEHKEYLASVWMAATELNYKVTVKKKTEKKL